MSFGELSVGEMSVRGNCAFGKLSFGELHFGELPVEEKSIGELSVGEMSVGNCPDTYNNDNGKKYFYQYCLHGCKSEEVLKNHLGGCQLHGAQRIKLPEADDKKMCNKVKFTKTEYQLPLHFVIYADFESVLPKQDSCDPLSSKFFTTQYQQHVQCGSCIYVKCSNGWYFEPPQVNIEYDAIKNILDQVLAAATICRQHLANKISMKRLTQEQWREYNNATNCSIWPKPCQQTEKSATTIIWRVNIEVQLTMHATWITTFTQRKWKFHASFTTSKVLLLCFSYFHNY